MRVWRFGTSSQHLLSQTLWFADNKYMKIKYFNINKKHIKNKLNVFFWCIIQIIELILLTLN